MQLKSSTSLESCLYTITGAARNVVKLGQGTGAKGNQLIMIIKDRLIFYPPPFFLLLCSLISLWWHITESKIRQLYTCRRHSSGNEGTISWFNLGRRRLQLDASSSHLAVATDRQDGQSLLVCSKMKDCRQREMVLVTSFLTDACPEANGLVLASKEIDLEGNKTGKDSISCQPTTRLFDSIFIDPLSLRSFTQYLVYRLSMRLKSFLKKHDRSWLKLIFQKDVDQCLFCYFSLMAVEMGET